MLSQTSQQVSNPGSTYPKSNGINSSNSSSSIISSSVGTIAPIISRTSSGDPPDSKILCNVDSSAVEISSDPFWAIAVLLMYSFVRLYVTKHSLPSQISSQWFLSSIYSVTKTILKFMIIIIYQSNYHNYCFMNMINILSLPLPINTWIIRHTY